MRILSIIKKAGFKGTPSDGFPSSVIPNALTTEYKKGNISATVGLGDFNIPPTLQCPRGSVKTKYSDGKISISRMTDSDVIGWIEKATDEEILNFIESPDQNNGILIEKEVDYPSSKIKHSYLIKVEA